VAATIIATGAGSNSKVVFVDRGTVSGVQRGMAVVTPDGIVGKVIAAYPTAVQVLLITDPDFAAGVVSQKNQVHGTLKGQGTPQCKVDYVAFEEKVEPGEWVYTSGDDRIFPRGFPVGVVKAVRPAQPFKEILVEPSGMQRGLEDVLILIEGVHQGFRTRPGDAAHLHRGPAAGQRLHARVGGAGAPWGPKRTGCARSIRRSARNRSTRTAHNVTRLAKSAPAPSRRGLHRRASAPAPARRPRILPSSGRAPDDLLGRADSPQQPARRPGFPVS
jgi:rod shape-determining protein MreC